MAIKYISIFQFKPFQSLPKLEFGLKINHLATLPQMRQQMIEAANDWMARPQLDEPRIDHNVSSGANLTIIFSCNASAVKTCTLGIL
jgi:hypothetical protein